MRHRLLILGALAVTGLVVSATALAATTLTPTGNVTGAGSITFSLPSSPSFTDTLDGTDHLVSYAPVLGVIDARGSGAGWNLTMDSTSFDDGLGHTLAAGSLTGVTAACQGGNACTAPTSSGITYPLSLGAGAAKFFNAAAGSGLGMFDVTPSIDVSIPGNAYAGTYTATVTLAAVSGP